MFVTQLLFHFDKKQSDLQSIMYFWLLFFRRLLSRPHSQAQSVVVVFSRLPCTWGEQLTLGSWDYPHRGYEWPEQPTVWYLRVQGLRQKQRDFRRFQMKVNRSARKRTQDTGHLACAASALQLSYNNRIITSPHTPLYVLHRWDCSHASGKPLSMCLNKSYTIFYLPDLASFPSYHPVL